MRARWHCLSLVLVVAATAAGCRTPPTVGPFVEATSALHVVTASLGNQLEQQVVDAAARETFRATWAPRAVAMQAVADYASGLAQVVEAGRTGEDAAAEVIGGAKQLLSTVGLAFRGGDAAVELVGKAVVKGYGLFAQDRAAASVAAAIEEASPAVDELTIALARDLQVLHRLVDTWQTGARTDLQARFATVDGGGARLLRSLREGAAAKRIAAANAAKAAERETLLAEAVQFETLAKQEHAADWHGQLTTQLQRIDRTAAAQHDTLRAAGATLLAWRSAHADLARASRTGMTPNYTVLLQFTRDLLQAYTETNEP